MKIGSNFSQVFLFSPHKPWVTEIWKIFYNYVIQFYNNIVSVPELPTLLTIIQNLSP